MGSLWTYIEGMDGLSLHFTAIISSDLAAWARFGTSSLFERHLLLQYDLVLPSSSTHVAILYLGPMRSLWTYSKGMDGLHLLFKRAHGSDLAAWARFGTLALFNGRLLLRCVWVQLNSFLLVATLYLGPMRSLWTYIEGMDGLHLLFHGGKQLKFNSLCPLVCAGFGTLTLFERCLLLQYALVLLNSSKHVATL